MSTLSLHYFGHTVTTISQCGSGAFGLACPKRSIVMMDNHQGPENLKKQWQDTSARVVKALSHMNG